jgi:hypothetical protein
MANLSVKRKGNLHFGISQLQCAGWVLGWHAHIIPRHRIAENTVITRLITSVILVSIPPVLRLLAAMCGGVRCFLHLHSPYIDSAIM